MDITEINLLAEQSACYRCLDERTSRTLLIYLDLTRAEDVYPTPPEPDEGDPLQIDEEDILIGGEQIFITPV